MNNYQVLYRHSVEYSYLVLFYKDLANSPRTTPQILYAFQVESDDSSNLEPLIVKNIHGSEVYKRYLDRGWQDVTKLKKSIPSPIRTWLSEEVEKREQSHPVSATG